MKSEEHMRCDASQSNEECSPWSVDSCFRVFLHKTLRFRTDSLRFTQIIDAIISNARSLHVTWPLLFTCN